MAKKRKSDWVDAGRAMARKRSKSRSAPLGAPVVRELNLSIRYIVADDPDYVDDRPSGDLLNYLAQRIKPALEGYGPALGVLDIDMFWVLEPDASEEPIEVYDQMAFHPQDGRFSAVITSGPKDWKDIVQAP